jgi:cell division protein FtsB
LVKFKIIILKAHIIESVGKLNKDKSELEEKVLILEKENQELKEKIAKMKSK